MRGTNTTCKRQDNKFDKLNYNHNNKKYHWFVNFLILRWRLRKLNKIKKQVQGKNTIDI